MEILGLVSKGLSNREISELLGISTNTVKIHVAAILRALDVGNRTEATFVYRELLTSAQESEADPVGARVEARIGRPRIAVLPFSVVGELTDGSLLSQGLAEDLITRLSAWRWFPVIAHASSQRYSPEDLSRAEIRRSLGASYLITGSVQAHAGAIRVNVHLLDTDQGQGLWSATFDLASQDLLQTQKTIASRIVATVAPELIHLEGQLAAQANEPDYTAWALNCRGMQHLERRTKADIDMALDFFEQAVTKMPNFALPWYGMVWAYHHRLWDQMTDDPETDLKALAEAAWHCERAEPRSVSAQIALGLMQMLQGDRAAAIARFERAVALNPSAAQAYSLLGQCYGLDGRPEECIAALEEALELNPLAAAAWIYLGVIALANFSLGDYPEAIRRSDQGLSENPFEPSLLLTRIAASAAHGQDAQAREFVTALRTNNPDFRLANHLALIEPVTRPQDLAKYKTALTEAGLELQVP